MFKDDDLESYTEEIWYIKPEILEEMLEYLGEEYITPHEKNIVNPRPN